VENRQWTGNGRRGKSKSEERRLGKSKQERRAHASNSHFEPENAEVLRHFGVPVDMTVFLTLTPLLS
jgi:hypothetical protein